jgi:hypothetical protein
VLLFIEVPKWINKGRLFHRKITEPPLSPRMAVGIYNAVEKESRAPIPLLLIVIPQK